MDLLFQCGKLFEQHLFNSDGQSRNGWLLEKETERKLDAEAFRETSGYQTRHHRIASQRKEIGIPFNR